MYDVSFIVYDVSFIVYDVSFIVYDVSFIVYDVHDMMSFLQCLMSLLWIYTYHIMTNLEIENVYYHHGDAQYTYGVALVSRID